MQDNYVGMQDNNDNMQDNYVTVAEMIFFPTWMVRERRTNAKCTQSSEWQWRLNAEWTVNYLWMVGKRMVSERWTFCEQWMQANG